MLPRRSRRLVAGVVACAAAAGLAGCGADPYPGFPDEGTLHIGLVSKMNGFDPARAGEEIRSLCVLNTYDALYRYHYLKRPYELVPCLADGMPEVSADGKEHVIRLKRGVRFVDDACFTATGGKGREMTADDVVFSFLRLMDRHVQSTGRWTLDGKIVGLDEFSKASDGVAKDLRRTVYGRAAGYPEVDGLRALDRYTVRIGLLEPYPQLTFVLAMPYLSVVPKEAVAFYGAEFLNHAVGTGPYRVAEYRPAQRCVLERNPAYREETFPSEGAPGDREAGLLEDAGRRLPLNDRVVMTVLEESQPRWLYFESGYLDRIAVPKDNYATAIDAGSGSLSARLLARGIRLWKEPQFEVLYDTFNMNDPVVGKGEKARAIRRALSLATNYAWAAANLYNGQVEDMQGPIARECAEWDPTFVNPWKPAAGEDRAHVLARARKVLEDGGWKRVEDVPVLVVDVPESTTDDDHFRAWQRDAAEVGLRLKPFKTDWQGMNARIEKGEAQIFGMAWMGDYPDAQNFLQLFYGPNKAPGPNGANYVDPDFDAKYESTISMQPGPERTRIYRELERKVVDDCVWVVRQRRITPYLAQPWLHGHKPSDLSPKYFAFARVDAPERGRGVAELNRPRPALPAIALASFAALVVVTFVVGSHRRRGW